MVLRRHYGCHRHEGINQEGTPHAQEEVKIEVRGKVNGIWMNVKKEVKTDIATRIAGHNTDSIE